MAGSALIFSELLRNFNEIRLIQVIQGVAVTQLLLNIAALWKQEARNPSLTSADPRAAGIPAFLGQVPQRRRIGSRPGRAGAGHLGLLDAGHPARAVWGRDSETDGRPDHGAHRVLCAGYAGRIWPCRKDARTQRRSLSDRRIRRGCRRVRILGGDLLRAVELRAAVPDRHRIDWFWWRAVRGGHAHRGNGAGAGWRERPRARHLGRRAGDRGRKRNRDRWRLARRGVVVWPRAARSAARLPIRRPVTASSTTSKSRCCSPLWLRSVRSCARYEPASRSLHPNSAWPNFQVSQREGGLSCKTVHIWT